MLDHELSQQLVSNVERPGLSSDRESFLREARAKAGGLARADQVEHAIREVFRTLDMCAVHGLHYVLAEVEGPAPQEFPKHIYGSKGEFLGQAENAEDESAILESAAPEPAPEPAPSKK